ncbi:multidrug efflux pump subunit AcrA (membrane-fusion protein) [Aquimarina sp. EL_43]|uniref:HlyD family secretion protein n=1 Tax=Aquimarina TaxID=290174 RepID=UPI000472E263|nr:MULTISPECIES: HlyD family efflux transporter periplasmic adaptor subunit [Aquimarina]MBG6132162.1 multidrug efflux pump subunit AcrA (membrane-fusion protein) [Aquimarina sp. EL_35]MBG6152959.1 multidrug efflux pump subunit AcrA (membrane-fusion protein) [Aquimarina sp. EL_32]MBG6170966.1 multidrug efflux pump subunit AcrA (membrane-fusion protein) [Aquimarina sp. EL_43]
MPDTLDDIQLRSEEVQEILTRVPHWMIRWGNLLILVLVLLLLFLSWLVKYPDVIPAEAIITTRIPPQKEYAKTSGKIESLFVKDNQIVPKNTPLAILESSANYKDVFLLKSIVDTIKVNTKSFTFPIDELPVLFLGDIETSFALFENSYSEYILNKELQPFSNEAIANQTSLSELYRRLESLKAQKRLGKAELEFKRKELQRQKNLFEKGVISAQEYESKELDYLRTKRNYENNDVQLSQINESISNATKTSKGTEINKRKEEINLFKKVLQSFGQLKKSIKDWELQYVLKSDIEGRVSFLNFWTENQTVALGDLVFIIIPSEYSSYLAKIKAPSQNSGKIKVGQTANIRLENFPDNEFGTLKGKVKHISLLPDKDGLYLIDVELPEKLITTYDKEIPFKQEMRGVVEIVTEDLRLIERFFYQFRTLMDK